MFESKSLNIFVTRIIFRITIFIYIFLYLVVYSFSVFYFSCLLGSAFLVLRSVCATLTTAYNTPFLFTEKNNSVFFIN